MTPRPLLQRGAHTHPREHVLQAVTRPGILTRTAPEQLGAWKGVQELAQRHKSPALGSPTPRGLPLRGPHPIRGSSSSVLAGGCIALRKELPARDPHRRTDLQEDVHEFRLPAPRQAQSQDATAHSHEAALADTGPRSHGAALARELGGAHRGLHWPERLVLPSCLVMKSNIPE